MSGFFKQKKYSGRIILFALFLYFTEIILLIWVSVSFIKNTGNNILGVSAIRIDKENVVFQAEGTFKYFYEWHANKEIVHKRTWLPTDVVANTNADGLIGDTDYVVNKPEGVFRIVAIGDSFTEGPFVKAGLTYPKLLEKMLNATSSCPGIDRYEVLNLGVGGYDIEYAAHRLETKGLKYEPDLVLWLLKDDDFIERSEINTEKSIEYSRYVMDNLGGDIEKFDIYRKYAIDIGNSGKDLAEKIHGIIVNQQMEKEAHKEYFPIQESAVARVSAITSPIIVMATFEGTNTMFKTRMKLWSKQYGNLLLYDGIPRLEPGISTFEPHDIHPNKKGYQIIAENILRELKDKKLICPN